MTREEQIEDLRKENAELRARLDKSVELPCRIGDTIWSCEFYFSDGFNKSGRMTHRSGLRVDCSVIQTKSELLKACAGMLENNVFLTREEAESRLKKLKEDEI